MSESSMWVLPLVTVRTFRPATVRRILCVFPAYTKAFGTFDHAFPLMGPVKAFMPPQGILLIAALVPQEWEVRFIDENIRPVLESEFVWADAVLISGMHIQRKQIHDIARRAHVAGKVTVLGGPSVSAAPEDYQALDYLHCGEVGDATLQLFRQIDKTTARPEQQIIYRTVDRLPMTDFPTPAYRLINVRQYLLGCVQYSSGCPFTCEFCDIPALYGRNPRLKTPEQILAELDELADGGTPSIYFVDDNFIANPRAARELLPHLVAWQKRRDYTVRLSCELTFNVVEYPEILALMREAFMTNIFIGIETVDPDALRAMSKKQNVRTPMLDAVETVNSYGIEIAAGIIIGLDTDTPETIDAILEFITLSKIPIVTPNLLVALPHTPLYERLEKANRLNSGEGRDSNIEYLQPYEEVVANWKRVIRETYEPRNIYARYAAQGTKTYPLRKRPTRPLDQLTWPNLRRAIEIFARTAWRVGICSDYRKEFWKMTRRELRQGNVESVFQIAMVAHHLITFGRECLTRDVQASAYSARGRDSSLSFGIIIDP
ncbi:MAG: B12-binding domain-containing radical SAM protein [Nitrospirota bacterium]|nr:B12-binding domain-containing radical SAM protein [Nitrospirota bacterium]MDH5585049.1 B12-binding domain-containing radical SAM protein [Nitrospirota bacterium]MDH5773574.1 B12-binding domain-containing radical SAM protein [Nitrospirota bacterium]